MKNISADNHFKQKRYSRDSPAIHLSPRIAVNGERMSPQETPEASD